MSPELDALLKVASGLAIALFSAWVTVQLSRKKFRSERWWEKKVAAYERVLEAFYEAKKFSSEHLDALYDGRKVEEARNKELRSFAAKPKDEIARAADLGAFVLSDRALQLLNDFHKEEAQLSSEPTWQDFLESDYALMNKYLKQLLDEARADLQR